MGHTHGHAHSHLDPSGATLGVRRRLAAALGIALVVLVAQVVGGLLTGSLALLADAAHVATDAAGLALALFAAAMSARPPSGSRTYGWQRTEVLAAAVNALLLGGAAVWVVVAALSRLRDLQPVHAGGMLGVALVGLLANGLSLWLLHSARESSLNLRGAYLEVFADLLGSAAVIVAAGVVAVTGSAYADVVVGVLIGCAVLPRTWRLLSEAVDVLLEAAPRGVDLAEVRQHLLATPGVLEVHDLHAWTISSGLPVLSAHVVVQDELLADGHGGAVLDHVTTCLAEDFDVRHCTFQLEAPGHADHEGVLHA
jgi:cation diffusion facilitator family transporter